MHIPNLHDERRFEKLCNDQFVPIVINLLAVGDCCRVFELDDTPIVYLGMSVFVVSASPVHNGRCWGVEVEPQSLST